LLSVGIRPNFGLVTYLLTNKGMIQSGYLTCYAKQPEFDLAFFKNSESKFFFLWCIFVDPTPKIVL
jgi:hypothetical protein